MQAAALIAGRATCFGTTQEASGGAEVRLLMKKYLWLIRMNQLRLSEKDIL